MELCAATVMTSCILSVSSLISELSIYMCISPCNRPLNATGTIMFNTGSTEAINISLEESVYFYMEAYHIDIYDCPDIEVQWEIERADGEKEVYTVVNETYHYGRYIELPDRGVEILERCYSYCEVYLVISPTDMRYNGAVITGIVDHPQCFNSSNVTDPFTLNIQGNTQCPQLCCKSSTLLVILIMTAT